VAGYVDLGSRLPSRTAEWSSDDFAAKVSTWVAEVSGPVRGIEPAKIRPWAAVFAVETDSGRYFAKQNCVTQSFEAALLELLGTLVPDRVIPLAAADEARGLLLTPDQGPVLGETAGDDLEAWCRTVSAGAALQRELVPHLDRLVGLGLASVEPTDAPAYLELRLSDLGQLPADDPRRLADDDAAAVRLALPSVRRWSDLVGALGLPTTLDHNDLHERSVFANGDELRFFDFADAVLAEPLAVLLIPLYGLMDRLGAGLDDPRVRRVADAALEVWSDLAPPRQLRRALPAALRLALLPRYEAWARCSVAMSDDELAEWGGYLRATLTMLVDDPQP
jgi:hypothetical protein